MSKEWYATFIEKAGLSDYIKVRAVSGYLHIRKPDKGIFLKALKLAGVKGNETIYIDDRGDIIKGAEKLGINVIIFDGNINKLKKSLNNYIKN